MKSRLKNLDRICLIMVIVISVSSGYWVVNTSAKQQKDLQFRKELFLKRSKELSLADKSLKQHGKILDMNKGALKSLNERIPESVEIGAFLRELDSLMNKRGIRLLSVQPLPPQIKKNYTRIPIHLIFNGSYINVYHLLHDLESMTRILVIEKLNISKPSISTDCRVDLTVSVFER